MQEWIGAVAGLLGLLVTVVLERRRLAGELKLLWQEIQETQARLKRRHAESLHKTPPPLSPSVPDVVAANNAPKWTVRFLSVLLGFLRTLTAMTTSMVALPAAVGTALNRLVTPVDAPFAFGLIITGAILGVVFLRKKSWKFILTALVSAIFCFFAVFFFPAVPR